MSQTACPPHDTLAAFAELGLSGADRDQVVRHLRDCEDCYAMFVETARMLRPEGFDDSVPAPVLRKGRGRRVIPWLLPVAAAAALAVVVIRIPRSPHRGAASASGTPVVGPASEATASIPPPETAGQATGTAQTPAWLQNAPWDGSSRLRLGFGPPSGRRQSFLLGMHLAALDRSCAYPQREVRTAMVKQVTASLAVSALMAPADRQRVSARAEAGECGLDTAKDPKEPAWQALGRSLEEWRMAAVLRDSTAVAPGQRTRTLELLQGVDLEEKVRREALRLVPGPQTDGDWDALEATLLQLIELLCA